MELQQARPRAPRPHDPWARRRSTLAKYGLTPERFDEMVEEQAGGCAICGGPPERGVLNVDHDHATEQVRELLCDRCNKGLGMFGDDPELLHRAAEYVKKHKEQGPWPRT